jgi:hypothetical protein
MSKSFNQIVKSWKDFESRLGASIAHGNLTLIERDILTLSRALALNMCHIHELLGYEDSIPNRLISVFKKTDIQTVAKLNKKLFIILARSRAGDSVMTRFKHEWSLLVGDQPMDSYFGVVMKCIKNFDVHRSPSDFSVINQFLTGWSRIQISSYDHSSANISSYIKTEDRLKDLRTPDCVLNSLNSIIKEWFNSSPIMISSREGHSSGSVADSERCTSNKYDALSTDPLLYYSTGEVPVSAAQQCSRISKTIFVPKTLLGDRVISMEPTTLQYWQQSVMKCLDKWFRSGPLRHAIFLHDQTINRDAAKLASLPQSGIATIDLSSASDSVSYRMVKRLFKGTHIMRWLVSTRSTHTRLPDGTLVKLEKFAPMGSSLCFPVECLVFSAICELAYRVSGVKRHKGISPLGYLVYGDDIVVPTKLWNTVSCILESCGFIVNEDKSFQHDSLDFRESCGGEYFRGVDVTPLKLPRNFCLQHGPIKYAPSWYSQSIDLCNRYFARGIRYPRSRVLSDLLTLPQPYRPIFGPEGLMSVECHNKHIAAHYDEELQLYQVEHGGVVSDTSRGNEYNAYLHWLHVTRDRKEIGDYPITTNTGPNTTRVGRVKSHRYTV